MKKIAISFVFLIGSGFFSLGQNITTKGKEFWLGFMENPSNPNLLINISSSKNTSGTISIPLSGYSQYYSVSADSVSQITIPTTLALVTTSEVIENKGIQITANDSVNIVAINSRYQSTDATFILPSQHLGLEYLIISYPPGLYVGSGSKSLFLIIASQDNTNINVTLSDSTIGGIPPDITFSIILQEGEVYQIKSNGDLTGSKITSSQPIAVFGGNVCTAVPVDKSSCDHLYEQLYPIALWGMEYIITPFMSRNKGNTYRILASADSTQITINGSSVFVLNKGEYFEQISDSALIIYGSKPIAIAQFSNSASYDSTNYGDPFMMILNSNNQTITSGIFGTISGGNNNIKNHFINIISKTYDINQVQLDSSIINPSLFNPILYSSYSYASLPIDYGIHTITSESSIIAYIYGFGIFESYGYNIGDAGRIIGNDNDENFFSNENIKIFPNPFSEKTTIEMYHKTENPKPVIFIIYDPLGKKVKEIRLAQSKIFELSRDGMSSGIYFYSIFDKENFAAARGKLAIQ